MDDFLLRITFLIVGLIIGWTAGTALTAKRYAEEMLKALTECNGKVSALEALTHKEDGGCGDE
jgi:hypothetical protein